MAASSPIPQLDANDAFLWQKRIEATPTMDGEMFTPQLASSVVGFGDDVYFVGIYNGTIVFSETLSLTIESSGIYIAKFDSTGEAVWATSVGEYGLQNGSGPETNQQEPSFRLAVTATSVYVSGIISTPFSFTLTDEQFNFSLGTPFVLRLTAAGSVVFVRQIVGPQTISNVDICVDDADNAYITGDSEGKVKLEGQFDAIDVTAATFYVAKIDSDGDWQYLVQPSSSGLSTVSGLSTDQEGNAHVVGTFSKKLTFSETIFVEDDGLASNTFLARIDYRGVWISATTIQGTLNNDKNSNIIPTSISEDANSNVYVMFTFKGSYLINNIVYNSLTASRQNSMIDSGEETVSMLLVKYDERYSAQWVRQLVANIPPNGGSRPSSFSGVNPSVSVNVKGAGLLVLTFFTKAFIAVSPQHFQQVTTDPDMITGVATALIVSFNDDGSYNWLTLKEDIRTNRQEPISAAAGNYYVATEIDIRSGIQVIQDTGGADGVTTSSVVFLGRLRGLELRSDVRTNVRTDNVRSNDVRRSDNRRYDNRRSDNRRYDEAASSSSQTNRYRNDNIVITGTYRTRGRRY